MGAPAVGRLPGDASRTAPPRPEDEQCPGEFKAAARAALNPPLAQPRGVTDIHLRQALLKFIADFANWDAAADPVYLDAAHALVKAAHGEEPPPSSSTRLPVAVRSRSKRCVSVATRSPVT